MKLITFSSMVLFLDLDDTIFQTSSINPAPFQKLIDRLIHTIKNQYSIDRLTQLKHDLWSIPFDQVAIKHQLPSAAKQNFTEELNGLEFKLDIEVFSDYIHLKNIHCKKFLITTGFRKLQQAKIDALGIQDDFIEIAIDDITEKIRQYKQGIFQELIKRHQLSLEQIWVIGDNPASELMAAHSLGLKSIQRLNPSKPLGSHVHATISGFDELESIFDLGGPFRS